MRWILPIVLLILMPQMLLAYEPGLLNLSSPAELESGQAEIKIQHRFLGDVTNDTLNTLFGADLGANIGIGLRYEVSGFELGVSRLRNMREYILAVGYGHALPDIPLRGQADVHFFRYEVFDAGLGGIDKRSGAFGILSLQTEPLLDRFTATANAGYDGREEEFGAGFGVAITIIKRMGLLQRVGVIGEYFPATSKDDNEKSFAFGLRFETYGHDFDFIVGNNTDMGLRHLMVGAMNNADLHFGFNIKRRI